MNLIKHLYVLALAFMILSITISCKEDVEEIETAYFNSAINNLNVANYTKWIVVLPGLGCHGCIQEAEAFMKDNVEKTDILFVLTNISSLKILQQKIGVQVKDYSNVYVDRENVFNIPTDNSIYPCIIKVENSKITTHEFQSPKNGQAFRKLESLISAQ